MSEEEVKKHKKHHKHSDEQCDCDKETCDCECDCENDKKIDDTYEEAEPDLQYQTSLEDKVMEYLQTAQRLQAEFDNYRKKAQEQIAQARFDGMADAVKQLLPALDSLANAKKMITDEKMLEGFVMIENQILNAFKALGVEKIETENLPFDPNLHNALAMQHNPDLDDDIIVNEYQAGYKIKDKIIRYSQVIVNKKEE